jgi:cytochrome c biogenesis protein CcdA
MLGLTMLALSIGVADSVNPSTIGPVLYLATGESAVRKIVGFALGAFTAYFLGGVLLTLGPGQALLAVLPRPGPRATHIVEICVGVFLVLVAIVLWLARESVARRIVGSRLERRSSFAFGAVIMVVELPTAVPYFAVIATIVGSGRSVPSQLGLLLVFNVAFVAPLLAIAAVRRLAPRRGDELLARLRSALDRRAAVVVPVLLLLIALGLLGLGTSELVGG